MTNIKRWDVYDVADHLDDMPFLIMQAVDDHRLLPEVARDIQRFAQRLYALAEVGGTVGPFPKYESKEDPW